MMIPSRLFAFVAILSSFAAANGAVVQRDGTFTFLTPTSSMSVPSSIPTSSRPTTVSSSISVSSVPVSPSSFPPSSGVTVTSRPTSSSQASIPTSTGTLPPVVVGTVTCTGLQQWQSSFAYSAGDRVIFNGQLYTAKQWTYDNSPPAHPDQWTAGGTCTQPVNNQANCSGVSAWSSTVAYVTGNRVTYNGHLWAAVQWTQSNVPSDFSGSWKDQGACA